MRAGGMDDHGPWPHIAVDSLLPRAVLLGDQEDGQEFAAVLHPRPDGVEYHLAGLPVAIRGLAVPRHSVG